MARFIITAVCSLSLIFQLLIVFVNCQNNDTAEVNFVSRLNWGAQPPTGPPKPLAVLPSPYVIISHTASQPCLTPTQCSQACREIQTYHIESKSWNDIAYNFLVGGDGNVYVGRGWDVEGAHTYGFNSKSIGITFIGTFSNALPTEQQLQAAQSLLEFGVENGKLTAEYKLLAHRQVSATISPGEVLYRIIQTWPHWSAKP